MNHEIRQKALNQAPAISSQPMLRILQASSALLFSIFLLLHLSNTLLAIAGEETYDSVQLTLQLIYQQPLFEWVFVFIPLSVHALIGIYHIFRAKKSGARITRRQWWHRMTGIFLLLVVVGHVAATRGIGYFYNAPPGFSGVSFSLWWMPWIFYPYYILLFVAGFSHMLGGLLFISRRYMRREPSWLAKNLNKLNLLAVVFVFVALLSFDGRLFKVSNPTDNDYARAYSRIFSIELP